MKTNKREGEKKNDSCQRSEYVTKSPRNASPPLLEHLFFLILFLLLKNSRDPMVFSCDIYCSFYIVCVCVFLKREFCFSLFFVQTGKLIVVANGRWLICFVRAEFGFLFFCFFVSYFSLLCGQKGQRGFRKYQAFIGK